MEMIALSSVVLMKAMEEGSVDSAARFVGILMAMALALAMSALLLIWILSRTAYNIYMSIPFKMKSRINSSENLDYLLGSLKSMGSKDQLENQMNSSKDSMEKLDSSQELFALR